MLGGQFWFLGAGTLPEPLEDIAEGLLYMNAACDFGAEGQERAGHGAIRFGLPRGGGSWFGYKDLGGGFGLLVWGGGGEN